MIYIDVLHDIHFAAVFDEILQELLLLPSQCPWSLDGFKLLHVNFGNESISLLGKFGKSSTQKCQTKGDILGCPPSQ